MMGVCKFFDTRVDKIYFAKGIAENNDSAMSVTMCHRSVTKKKEKKPGTENLSLLFLRLEFLL